MIQQDDHPSVPCICDSGKYLEQCCLREIYFRQIDQVSITPPPPTTGSALPGCYLAPTNDCGEKLSAEHYVSEFALRHVDAEVRVSGFPWLRSGETRDLPIGALVSGILCDRHNSALSPLDKIGGDFVWAIGAFANSDMQPKRRVAAFNGRDVERWMLKTLFGLIRSRSLQSSPGRRMKVDVTERCVQLLYDQVPFQPGRGLYVHTNSVTDVALLLSARPLINPTSPTLHGLIMSIFGFEFLTSTSPIAVDGGAFRPSIICFVRSDPSSSRVIKFHWDEPGPVKILYFNHQRKAEAR